MQALSSRNIFLYSETLEGLGTLDLKSGADKHSRRFFKRAWIDPAKAVVSHSQWVLREHLPQLASNQKIDFSQSQEATSWLKHYLLDFRGAIEAANEWFMEEPYSAGPPILGSNIACVLEDFEAAEAIIKRGLIANPKNETLLNNLAFAQLRSGKLPDAEKTIAPLIPLLNHPDQIAPAATYGLLLMSKGQLEAGTRYYSLAVKRAADKGDRRLVLRAILSYLISSVDLTQSLDLVILKSAESALLTFHDAGSIAIAAALARRMQTTTMPVTPETQSAMFHFIESVADEKREYLESDIARSLLAEPMFSK